MHGQCDHASDSYRRLDQQTELPGEGMQIIDQPQNDDH
jgi:hypothetical protein